MKPKRRRLNEEQRIFLLVLLAGLPSALLLLLALSRLGWSGASLTLVGIFSIGPLLLIAHHCRFRFSYQLRSLSNLLEAIVNGDYSLRGRTFVSDGAQTPYDSDAYTDLVAQINRLADALSARRLEAKESQLLLAKVINNIDIALVAVDEHGAIVHANNAFCALFNLGGDSIRRKSLHDLGISEFLSVERECSLDWEFPGKIGKFSVYRDQFIEDGRPHQLMLIRDLRLLLRSEERQAWQKLIRVIGHEINNSLSPISSLSASLVKISDDPDKAELVKHSLGVIHARAKGLIHLVSGYREIAKLPAPRLAEVNLAQLLSDIRALYPLWPIEVRCQRDPCPITGDRAQLEQVIINLLKNAHESQLLAHEKLDVAHHPAIVLQLRARGAQTVELAVIDQGTGVSNPGNLFVPFYTTKENGSGIGLAISRQIIEAHRGELSIRNRESQRGCEAIVSLPLPHNP